MNVNGNFISEKEFLELLGQSYVGLKNDGTRKPGIQLSQDAKNNVFTSDGKHISTLVNTEYIQGNGIETIIGIKAVDSSLKNISVINSNEGDGMVALYSGICGLSTEASNVHIINNVTHGDMLSCEETINLITNLISTKGK